MNNNRLNNKKKGLSGLTAAACGLLLLCGCSDFLEPKPLSFYDPTTTFTTEAGLQATMAAADKQLRDIWINGESNALALEYRLSELAANGKTDESNPFCDINGTLTPTNMRDQTGWFWNDVYYSGIKFPNTILTYINGVEGLEEATKNAYIGRAYFHRAIRYLNLVFQSYALLPHYNVFDNVAYGLKLRKVPKDEIRERVMHILDLVELTGMEGRMTNQLSGGQQQRVALARTLNQNPKIILADEPVASLDPITAKQVMQDFVRINKEYKISILLNIHHVDLALKYCDRVIGIRAGEIVFDGPASTITQEQIDEVYNGAKAPTMGEGEGELPKAARAEG